MKNEIIIDGVTYVRKSYEIGDIYKFSNMDWYIIGMTEYELKLMLKDVVETMSYSDNNSNDYAESNVREYLEETFINKLDKSKLSEMLTNYDEAKHIKSKVRIPTLREIEALPMSIRKANDWYWTMTASYGFSEDCSNANVFYVDASGFLSANGVGNTRGLRPVILVEV